MEVWGDLLLVTLQELAKACHIDLQVLRMFVCNLDYIIVLHGKFLQFCFHLKGRAAHSQLKNLPAENRSALWLRKKAAFQLLNLRVLDEQANLDGSSL